MDGAENGEGGEEESPPLKIDPKWCAQHAIGCRIVYITDRWPNVASKMLSGPSSNPSRPTMPASTSMPCTRGRQRSTTRTMSRSTTRTSTPPSFSCVAWFLLSRLVSLVFKGRSILCSQLGLRHRCPIETSARPQRPIRGPPPRHPPHPQSLCDPR